MWVLVSPFSSLSFSLSFSSEESLQHLHQKVERQLL
jgi:hypothetical protein